MEVFVGFDGSDDAVPFLEECLNGWEKVRFAVPAVVTLLPGAKFEIQRRLLADKLAHGDHYILSDIDATPQEPFVISQIVKRIASRPKCGLAFIRPTFDWGGKVRVIRKGLIEKWPKPITDNYDLEHGGAIIQAGYEVEEWNDIWYRQLVKADGYPLSKLIVQ